MKNKTQTEYRNFTIDDFESMCFTCGDKRYPNVRANAFEGIGIPIGTCPICRIGKLLIIPGRDWAYRAGVFEKYT